MRGTITSYELRKKGRKGKKSWGYRFRAGKNEAGKWIWIVKKGFEKETEAEQALELAIAEHKKNPNGNDPRTFSDFFDAYIREHCERHCEPTTVQGYLAKGEYAKHYFGDVPIVKLTPLQIETSLNKLRDHGGKKTKDAPKGRPLAAKTVREIAAVVNATFNAAIRWGVLDLNPMRRVTVPRVERHERKVLDKSQLDWLISACEGHQWLHLLLLLDAATGCRRGELLALTWSDIDFENGIVTISKSLAQTRTKGVFLKSPKGRKARRFSLSPSASEALVTHRNEQTKNRTMFGADYRSDLNLVFATPDGNYLKPDSVTAKVSVVARRLGFPKGVSLHTLRHTHGSFLLSLGVPLPTVSKRLGHANTHITATVYSHALEKDEQTSAEVWEKAMGDLGKKPVLPRVT
jgi:integrase